MNKFLTVVGQLKFRGTSVLFRLPQSPVKHQGDPYSYPSRPSCPSPIPIRLFPQSSGSSSSEPQELDKEGPEDMEISESGQ